jgi:hypothetical protein
MHANCKKEKGSEKLSKRNVHDKKRLGLLNRWKRKMERKIISRARNKVSKKKENKRKRLMGIEATVVPNYIYGIDEHRSAINQVSISVRACFESAYRWQLRHV